MSGLSEYSHPRFHSHSIGVHSSMSHSNSGSYSLSGMTGGNQHYGNGVVHPYQHTSPAALSPPFVIVANEKEQFILAASDFNHAFHTPAPATIQNHQNQTVSAFHPPLQSSSSINPPLSTTHCQPYSQVLPASPARIGVGAATGMNGQNFSSPTSQQQFSPGDLVADAMKNMVVSDDSAATMKMHGMHFEHNSSQPAHSPTVLFDAFSPDLNNSLKLLGNQPAQNSERGDSQPPPLDETLPYSYPPAFHSALSFAQTPTSSNGLQPRSFQYPPTKASEATQSQTESQGAAAEGMSVAPMVQQQLLQMKSDSFRNNLSVSTKGLDHAQFLPGLEVRSPSFSQHNAVLHQNSNSQMIGALPPMPNSASIHAPNSDHFPLQPLQSPPTYSNQRVLRAASPGPPVVDDWRGPPMTMDMALQEVAALQHLQSNSDLRKYEFEAASQQCGNPQSANAPESMHEYGRSSDAKELKGIEGLQHDFALKEDSLSSRSNGSQRSAAHVPRIKPGGSLFSSPLTSPQANQLSSTGASAAGVSGNSSTATATDWTPFSSFFSNLVPQCSNICFVPASRPAVQTESKKSKSRARTRSASSSPHSPKSKSQSKNSFNLQPAVPTPEVERSQSSAHARQKRRQRGKGRKLKNHSPPALKATIRRSAKNDAQSDSELHSDSSRSHSSSRSSSPSSSSLSDSESTESDREQKRKRGTSGGSSKRGANSVKQRNRSSRGSRKSTPQKKQRNISSSSADKDDCEMGMKTEKKSCAGFGHSCHQCKCSKPSAQLLFCTGPPTRKAHILFRLGEIAYDASSADQLEEPVYFDGLGRRKMQVCKKKYCYTCLKGYQERGLLLLPPAFETAALASLEAETGQKQTPVAQRGNTHSLHATSVGPLSNVLALSNPDSGASQSLPAGVHCPSSVYSSSSSQSGLSCPPVEYWLCPACLGFCACAFCRRKLLDLEDEKNRKAEKKKDKAEKRKAKHNALDQCTRVC